MKTGLLNIYMKDETFEQLDQLRKRLSAHSYSDTIRQSIELMDYLVIEQDKGNEILIEGKKKYKINIPISSWN